MTANNLTWGKIWPVVTGLLVPGVSALIMFAIWLTRLDDKLSSVITSQTEQGSSIKDIREDLKAVHSSIDTIVLHQRINKVDLDYRIQDQKRRSGR